MQGTSAICRPVVAFSVFLVALVRVLTCTGSPARVHPCLGRAHDDSAECPSLTNSSRICSRVRCVYPPCPSSAHALAHTRGVDVRGHGVPEELRATTNGRCRSSRGHPGGWGRRSE